MCAPSFIMETIKEKPKHRTRESRFDFVIPLQLEEITHIVEYHLLLSTTVRIVTRRKADAEQLEFEINLFQPLEAPLPPNARWAKRWHNRAELISARGYMQRWEGTSTRFRGTATTYHLPASALESKLLPPLILISTVVMAGVTAHDTDKLIVGILFVYVVPFFIVVFTHEIRLFFVRRRLSNDLSAAVQEAFTEVYNGQAQTPNPSIPV